MDFVVDFELDTIYKLNYSSILNILYIMIISYNIIIYDI